MPFVDNRGIRIHYDDAGAGPVVVLGHSFLCSGAMWRHQLPVLTAKFRVLNLDLRGHGRSGAADRPFSLYDALSDVTAVLDHAGVERAVWCGLSIGGMVALRAALTCPRRVGGLLLLDTSAGTESALDRLKYRSMGLGARLVGLAPFRSTCAKMMFGPTTRRRHPELVASWKDDFRRLHRPSILHGLEALMRRDSLIDRLEEIRVPALVLVGEEDAALPLPHSLRMQEKLGDSRLVRVPGAGHLSALERPEPVNRALLDFLEAHAG